jgi:ribosomal protein S27AE
MSAADKEVFSHDGHCSTCDRDVRFVAHHTWFRDFFVCSHCGSVPRERALILVIERWFPRWREAVIHESSPAARGASPKLARECPNCIGSQFFPEQSDKQTVNALDQGIKSNNKQLSTQVSAPLQFSFTFASILELHAVCDVTSPQQVEP